MASTPMPAYLRFMAHYVHLTWRDGRREDFEVKTNDRAAAIGHAEGWMRHERVLSAQVTNEDGRLVWSEVRNA